MPVGHQTKEMRMLACNVEQVWFVCRCPHLMLLSQVNYFSAIFKKVSIYSLSLYLSLSLTLFLSQFRNPQKLIQYNSP
jgi:hypothetical protein